MTNMPNADIPDLIDKYRRQTLAEAEREALQRWLNEHEDNRSYFEKITAPGKIEGMIKAILDMDRGAIRGKLEARRRGK